MGVCAAFTWSLPRWAPISEMLHSRIPHYATRQGVCSQAWPGWHGIALAGERLYF